MPTRPVANPLRGLRGVGVAAFLLFAIGTRAHADLGAPITSDTLETRIGFVDRVLTLEADSTRLDLPDRWIEPKSFRLELGDTLLARGVDYLLDPRAGWLRLLRAVPVGRSLHVRYRAFPVALRSEYRLHAPRISEERAEPPTAEPRTVANDPFDLARLELAGSKTFSVEVGTAQDLRLRQSLDLTVRGEIARDVEVRAILSDRDTPLQPDGTSSALSDLDRVLVEVDGKRAHLTMGDYRLELTGLEFTRYQRQLEGAAAEVTPGSSAIFLTGATLPGTLTSIEFLGEEGKQGPYRLSTIDPTAAGAIVAGSERVTLDGAQMERGETADYVIDYGEGTLTFTGRRVITAYSRIAVDFQLLTEAYRRGAFGGGAALWGGPRFAVGRDVGPGEFTRMEAPRPDAAGLSVQWVTERDDRHRPLGAALSTGEKAALAAAGDSLTDALRSGIEYVGPLHGEYEQVENDTLLTPFFLYVGQEQGSWRVRFDLVGEGKGDYVDTTDVVDRRYFVFVGKKRGDYLAGREVPRPSSTDLVSVAGRSARLLGATLSGELALSDHDANTASARDDGDNRGTALSAEISSPAVALGGVRTEIHANVRRVGSRFRPLDRLNAAYFGLDWNLDPTRLSSGDQRVGFGTRIEQGRRSITLDWQTLSNRADFDAERGVASARLPLGPLLYDGRWLEARSTDDLITNRRHGRRRNLTSALSWPAPIVVSTLSYAQERTENGQGAARRGALFHQMGLRLGSGARFERIRGALEWSERWTSSLDGPRQRLSDRGQTGQGEFDWTSAGGQSASLLYSVRRRLPEGGGTRETSQQGRVRWLLRALDEAVLEEGRIELASLAERDRVKEIRFVGEGAGHYDSLGVYQGVGDYDLFYRQGDAERPRNRLEASLRTEVDLERRFGGKRGESGVDPLRRALGEIARTLRLTQSWTLAADADRPVGELFADLGPILRADRDLPSTRASVRTDLFALPAARVASPRLRSEWSRSSTRLAPGDRERQASELWALRLRSRPSARWSLDLEPELAREAIELHATGRAVATSGWRSRRLRLDQDVSLGRGVTLSLDASTRARRRIGGEERARVDELTLGAVVSPSFRSRLELSGTRTVVVRRHGTGRPDRALERAGWTARFLASIRLRDSLDLSASLREQRPDAGREVREARMELRATF